MFHVSKVVLQNTSRNLKVQEYIYSRIYIQEYVSKGGGEMAGSCSHFFLKLQNVDQSWRQYPYLYIPKEQRS